MSAQPSSPETTRRRVWIASAAWGLGGTIGVLCLLLGIGAWIEGASVYPQSRRVSDEGVSVAGECPTLGSRVGSVRAPLCRWSIRRAALFETDDPLPQVYDWYRSRERTWEARLGPVVIELSLARVQPKPAPPTSALRRFSVGTSLTIDVLQP